MSRQLRLLLTDADIRDLEARVREIGDFRIISSRSSSPRPNHLLSMRMIGQTAEPLRIFLYLPSDVAKLNLVEVPAQKYWTVDPIKSPVLEFFRPYVGDGLIRAGRLYAKNQYYDGDHLMAKSQSFREWSDRVFKVARRGLRRNPSLAAYVGAEALALADKGDIRLEVS